MYTITDEEFRRILLHQSEYVRRGRAFADIMKLISMQIEKAQEDTPELLEDRRVWKGRGYLGPKS